MLVQQHYEATRGNEMTKERPEDNTVVVVGAGLAGLCCTRTLQRAGYKVDLYEATDGVGGRVRTDVVEGFRLDRGFQVLFTAYPSMRKEVDLPALDLRPFDPGADVVWDGSIYPFTDPFRRPKRLFQSAFSGLFPPADKVRLLKLRKLVTSLDLTDIFLLPDQNIHDFLAEFGFSPQFIDRFIRPLYSGVFLQRGLETSARMFAFVFKMQSEGEVVVPAGGMNAIPLQIARDLSPDSVHLMSPVMGLVKQDGQIAGITLGDGSTVSADVVVVATPADIAAHLTGLKLPQDKRSTTCLYFEIPRAFTNSRSPMVFADPNKYAGANSLVNNAIIITNVAPSYAPEGKHLLSVTIIGEPRLSDDEMASRARREIGSYFQNAEPEKWRLIRVYRIPWAQFAQPVGIFGRLPGVDTGVPGLILSGEIISSSSIHGALDSGRRAANAVLYATGKKTKIDRRK